jgi:hypothetical protein
MFAQYANVASLAVGFVLPAIVAVFTKPSTNSTVKGAAHAVLALATGFLAVRQETPDNFQWAPAVVASALAWLTGTTFYHSLLKNYGWFAWLQNAFVREAKVALAGKPEYVDYLTTAEAAEVAPANNFPLSTDLVQGAVQELETIPAVAQVVEKAEALPVVGQVVQAIDGHTQPAPASTDATSAV